MRLFGAAVLIWRRAVLALDSFVANAYLLDNNFFVVSRTACFPFCSDFFQEGINVVRLS